MHPKLVVHADWSTTPGKRWQARARWEHDRYVASASEPVRRAGELIAEARELVGVDGSALVGFDFPIGLPLAYAVRTDVRDFRVFLEHVGNGAWNRFFDVAAKPDDISLHRPFYPVRGGGARQSHLTEALGVDDIDALRRRCELAHANRRSAAPLFWTLGGQQVGKAAISGWREVLLPAIRDETVSIWPFDGELESLLRPGRVVIAETYPAELYRPLGVKFSSPRAGTKTGKRSSADRTANAQALTSWADRMNIECEPGLRCEIAEGFGRLPTGEDRFDAVVGLFGMLGVVLGELTPRAPENDHLRLIEGWILGRPSMSA